MSVDKKYHYNQLTDILHCDLDAFFASVEQMDNPSLRGKPVVVGGDMHSRGVVSTCSYEARKYGIRSAMPTAQAYRLCPQAVLLPVNMPRYLEVSKQVFAILNQYSPVMEIVSIDEAFLDISGCSGIFGSPEKIGYLIKKQVNTELGLTISVGISYNKFLAKLASDMDKPDGLRVIAPSQALDLLRPLPVSRIWGVGKKTQQNLEKLGLKTIGDIQILPPEWMEAKLGTTGRIFWELAHGIDNRELEPEHERKSMGREETFPEDIKDTAYLKKLIAQFAAELCRKLRKEDLNAASITIKIRYYDFKTITRRKTFPPCNSDITITQIANELLDQSYDGKKALRLFGLSLGNLSPSAGLEQGSLFDPQLTADHKRIDQLMDDIRERYGPRAINRANLLLDKEID
ncbi:MAG: DNA polymerase IV [Syntrophomonadaceae bacterium]|nr:DNA polymerase IV [Syntrophomonadaceae bacterium]MDD3024175.1 DNA polymerase IV [Syntrophomonadaceae bacterium]